MSIVMASIAGVSMNKIGLWFRAPVDDWTAEWTIIASNDSVASWVLLNGKPDELSLM